eukprot:4542126-Pyramimonas_sp.AAC.1
MFEQDDARREHRDRRPGARMRRSMHPDGGAPAVRMRQVVCQLVLDRVVAEGARGILRHACQASAARD